MRKCKLGINIIYIRQCPKLRVHLHLVRTFPRPGAQFSEVCTRSVHDLWRFYHYHILGGCMAKIQGAEFLGEVHPMGAQNKTLISDTVRVGAVIVQLLWKVDL